MPAVRALLLACLVAAAGAGRAAAQVVVVRGHGDPGLTRAVEDVVRDGNFLLVRHDTLIGRADTVRRSLVVVGGTLRLDGTVEGNLLGVGANFFLRPSAVITGNVVNAGGGYYPSANAHIGGTVLDRPLSTYAVTQRGDTLVLTSLGAAESPVRLDGLAGFHPPSYDRVDGLWLRAGAGVMLPLAALDSLELHGRLGYRTELGGITHRLELEGWRGGFFGDVGHEELTTTNDDWIRTELKNSISSLFLARDYRNYYAAERWFARVGRRFEGGRWTGEVALRGAREAASSLATNFPWTVLRDNDDFRANPAIDPGVISSVGADASAAWTGVRAGLELGGGVELAGKVAGGDFDFARFETWGDFIAAALSNQTLAIAWRAQGPLPGTRSLPVQRWSFVGGSGTLYTEPIGAFPGDRLVFVETRYIIPLPQRLALPLVGAPDFVLLHTMGMAWTADVSRHFEQNVGFELRFFGLSAGLVTNPSSPGHDLKFRFGLSFSPRTRPPGG